MACSVWPMANVVKCVCVLQVHSVVSQSRPQKFRWQHVHRRRSDWNSVGTHGGTYYKSPAVEAKKHIFLHSNASNLVLKILQHDKIWGTIPRSNFWGGGLVLSVIYAHEHVFWMATHCDNWKRRWCTVNDGWDKEMRIYSRVRRRETWVCMCHLQWVERSWSPASSMSNELLCMRPHTSETAVCIAARPYVCPVYLSLGEEWKDPASPKLMEN